MALIPLSEYIDEFGYPRILFLDESDNLNRKTPISEYSNPDYGTAANGPHDYYLDDEIFQLFRMKGSTSKNVYEMIKPHFISAVIKNVLLNDHIDDDIKYNMALFMVYYYIVFNANDKLTDAEISEGVLIYLATLISTIVNKSNTTYKKYDVNDVVEKLRALVRSERLAAGLYKTNINLRRTI